MSAIEEYGRIVVGRSPLPWPVIGVVVVMCAIASSWVNVKNSVVAAKDLRSVIEKAASRGDYEMAKKLLNQTLDTRGQKPVLGAESTLYDLAYPEQVLERRINDLEGKLAQYPENIQIYNGLAELYRQAGNTDKASEYLEKARVLDPNK